MGERSVNGDIAGSLALDPEVRIQMISRLFEEMEEHCSEGKLWKRFLEKNKGSKWFCQKGSLRILSFRNICYEMFLSPRLLQSGFCPGSSLQTSYGHTFCGFVPQHTAEAQTGGQGLSLSLRWVLTTLTGPAWCQWQINTMHLSVPRGTVGYDTNLFWFKALYTVKEVSGFFSKLRNTLKTGENTEAS